MISGILLTIAVLLIMVIAALLIILWAVPVTFTGRGELRHDAPTLIFAFCVHWGALSLQTQIPDEEKIDIILFGRTVRRIALETATPKQPETGGRGEEKELETDSGKRTSSPDILGIVDAVLTYTGALLRQISIDHLRASLRFGLGDAAMTGEVFGCLMALRGMLMATGGKASLAAVAVFDEPVIEGEAEGAIRIAHPLSLVPPVIRIIRHPAVWKMVRNR